jgi:hypothetical protein
MAIIMSDPCTVLFSRSIINDSRSIIDDSRIINDTSRVVIMTIVSDALSCSIILMTVEVPFTIVIFIYRPWVKCCHLVFCLSMIIFFLVLASFLVPLSFLKRNFHPRARTINLFTTVVHTAV